MMSNDAYINDDSYLQAQQDQESQQYELWVFEQKYLQEYLLEQANQELRMLHEQTRHTA